MGGVMVCVSTEVVCDQLCLTGDFDSQLQTILRKQMQQKHEIAEMLSRPLEDIRNTLNKIWKNYEIFPFGSLTTGLSTKTSDVDYYLRIPKYNDSMDYYTIERTVKVFQKQPASYSHLSYRIDKAYSLITFIHIPTQLYIDIVYKFGDIGVANSRLIKYYFKLDKRFLAMGGILKTWASTHQITGARNRLPNYGLYMLTIFYLQQKNMVPTVFTLQKHSKPHLIDNWDMGFDKIPYSSTNTENLYQLLGGFFKYYSEFNFTEYVVSTFVGYPVHMSAFASLDNVPQEFSLYKINLSGKHMSGISNELNMTTDLCIQDMFQHNSNDAARMAHEEASKFIFHIKLAAKMFEELPRDRILKAILTVDQHNNRKHKRITVDKLRKLNDCIKITVA